MKFKLLLCCTIFVQQLSAQCWESYEPGFNHATAINSDGRLRTIGYNGYGQIGDGTNIERRVFTMAGNHMGWIAVSGGGNHTMGLRIDGTLWTWGRNVQGELGIGTFQNKNIPTQVGTAANWTKIWAGSFNCFAQKSDGTLWSWGHNYYGQLGHTVTTPAIPEMVGTDTDWLDISPTPNFTVAIKTNGTLWQWGAAPNGGGQVPLQIGTATDWVMAKGGDEHIIALKADGTIWTWGSNQYGQLGNPDPNPDGGFMRQVGTDSDWTMVSAGQDHCLALKSNGTIWSWGDGAFGALGLGNVTDFNTPQLVGTATDWQSIKSQGAHNMAMKTNGTLHSWGENTYGQLGVIYPNGNRPSLSPCPSMLSVSQVEKPSIEVYPNPANGILNIHFSETFAVTSYRVTDQLGKVVLQQLGFSDAIDVSTLVQGIYFLELLGERKMVVKFMKQ